MTGGWCNVSRYRGRFCVQQVSGRCARNRPFCLMMDHTETVPGERSGDKGHETGDISHTTMEEKSLHITHDADIREPLFDYLEETYGKIRILEEKNTGRARADVVMITPQHMYGIEIKSDADTYTRLAKQVRYYDQYYDRNMVVVGSTHALHIKEHVPEWWGILSAEYMDGKMDFYTVREPGDNPKVQEKKKISLLWRSEMDRLLERNHLPKYRNRSRKFVGEKLLEKVPAEFLWPQVMEELFERDYTVFDEKY